MTKCVWALSPTFAFLVSFFLAIILMSAIYPLDSALAAF
jgi:hypothetical protein